MMRKGSALLMLLMVLTGLRSVAQQPDDDRPLQGVPMADYSNPKEYTIKYITVEGVKYMNPNSLVLASGLMPGNKVTIPGDFVTQAVETLWKRGYFSDVQIEAIPFGDSVNLVIHLQERPRVSEWKFTGVRKGHKSELIDKMEAKKGGELSDYVLDKNQTIIKKFYNEKGFLNTIVNTKILTDTTFHNAVTVVFDVDRGEKVRIGEITFEGNEAIPDKKLRKSLKKTHQTSINVLRNTKFNEQEFEDDLENVIDYYNSKGYRNAVITRDSTYTISPKRMGLAIGVEEGNKYYFRNINWIGNSVYPTSQLSGILGVVPGELYDKKTLHKRLGVGKETDPDNPYTVSSLYQNNGYLASQIDPAELVVGADSIDLNVKIYEGKQFSINGVDISGNVSINDEVIRRELDTRPGELYNRALVMNTLRQLAQSGSFTQNIMPDINPVSDQLVDIGWRLEEAPTDQVDISGGWGNGTFIGSVGLTLNNLSMKRLFSKDSRWHPYPKGQLQQLRLQLQTNGSYYKAVSLQFTEPWLGGKKPISLTVGGQYSSETDAYYAWLKPTQYFRTMGGYVGIGKRLKWPDRNFQLYTQVQYQRYSLKDWDYFLIENGNSNIVSFKAVLSRNSTDWHIFPRSGSEFSVGVQLTPPYSLWDGVDYSDPNLSDNERYKWIEYNKWTLKGQWFTTPFKSNKFVLALKAEMGVLGSYNKDKQSPFETSTVGGDGMSGYSYFGVDVVSLRGYENGALTPPGTYSRAYNKYAAELRYHILTEGNTTMYGMVFAEGGNAFSEWSQFDPFQLKRSLGFGVRVFMPMIQMIGADWAYGFDRAPGTNKRSGGHPHFYIGMQF